jgi:hypothetical protein
MRKIGVSVVLALLLMVVLAWTVYSQNRTPAVQVLQGGVNQQIPLEVQVLVPAANGLQTVTVPLVLNLNLSIGPVNAVDMKVHVQQSSPFVSPIATVKAQR